MIAAKRFGEPSSTAIISHARTNSSAPLASIGPYVWPTLRCPQGRADLPPGALADLVNHDSGRQASASGSNSFARAMPGAMKIAMASRFNAAR